jgi:mannose-6-phosphate isomerase-like protein (cupin superfamily)
VKNLQARIIKANSLNDTFTPERCYIAENCGCSTGDAKVSIARARVKPGVTTKAHHLKGVQEIYLIVKGKGKVVVGGFEAEVAEGDVVVIPPGVSQKVTNTGKTDLVFHCICTPAFTQSCYCDEETPNSP